MNIGKIAIVIVTYNRLLLLKEVVSALRIQSYMDKQLIVVNNGSTDGTSQWLKEQPDLIVINQANVGGAGGFYTGLKFVSEHLEYQYCWIMDDDVVCQQDALEKLLIAYNSAKNVGFVCSLVYGEENEPMNVPGVDTRPSSNGYPDTFVHLKEYGMVKVEYATFVSLLLKTDIIRDVGLPIKEFYIWGDDIEYTLRISRKYNCYLVGQSVVIHKRKVSKKLSLKNEQDKSRIDNFYYAYRNSLYIAKRYYSFMGYMKLLWSSLKDFFSLLLKLKFRKVKIIVKGVFNSFFFNPIITIPHKHG